MIPILGLSVFVFVNVLWWFAVVCTIMCGVCVVCCVHGVCGVWRVYRVCACERCVSVCALRVFGVCAVSTLHVGAG